MRIVFVCTTNVWGSAMAELISRQMLSERDPDRKHIDVISAGVRAEVGAPMPNAAQQVLAQRGIDASGHRARWMGTAILGDADLTLTMGEIQRDAALALNPRGLRSTFTLAEAASLLRGLAPVATPVAAAPNGHFRAVVGALANARRFRPVLTGADDLPDLLSDEEQVARTLADRLVTDLADLLDALLVPEFKAAVGTRGESNPHASASPIPAVA